MSGIDEPNATKTGMVGGGEAGDPPSLLAAFRAVQADLQREVEGAAGLDAAVARAGAAMEELQAAFPATLDRWPLGQKVARRGIEAVRHSLGVLAAVRPRVLFEKAPPAAGVAGRGPVPPAGPPPSTGPSDPSAAGRRGFLGKTWPRLLQVAAGVGLFALLLSPADSRGLGAAALVVAVLVLQAVHLALGGHGILVSTLGAAAVGGAVAWVVDLVLPERYARAARPVVTSVVAGGSFQAGRLVGFRAGQAAERAASAAAAVSPVASAGVDATGLVNHLYRALVPVDAAVRAAAAAEAEFETRAAASRGDLDDEMLRFLQKLAGASRRGRTDRVAEVAADLLDDALRSQGIEAVDYEPAGGVAGGAADGATRGSSSSGRPTPA